MAFVTVDLPDGSKAVVNSDYILSILGSDVGCKIIFSNTQSISPLDSTLSQDDLIMRLNEANHEYIGVSSPNSEQYYDTVNEEMKKMREFNEATAHKVDLLQEVFADNGFDTDYVNFGSKKDRTYGEN